MSALRVFRREKQPLDVRVRVYFLNDLLVVYAKVRRSRGTARRQTYICRHVLRFPLRSRALQPVEKNSSEIEKLQHRSFVSLSSASVVYRNDRQSADLPLAREQSARVGQSLAATMFSSAPTRPDDKH